MTIFKDLFLLQQLDYLIRTKSTGSPDQLAARLNTCKRNALRLISKLKDQGFPVAYDKHRSSYYYTESVKLNFEIIVGGNQLLHIRGGAQNYFIKNSGVPNFGTLTREFCIAESCYGAQ